MPDFPSLNSFSTANANAALALTDEVTKGPLELGKSPEQIEVPAGSLKAVSGDKFRGLPPPSADWALQTKTPESSSKINTTLGFTDKGQTVQVDGSTTYATGSSDLLGEGSAKVGWLLNHRNGGDNKMSRVGVSLELEKPIGENFSASGRVSGRINVPNEGSPTVTVGINGKLNTKVPVSATTVFAGSVGGDISQTNDEVTSKVLAEVFATQQLGDGVSLSAGFNVDYTLPDDLLSSTASVRLAADVSDTSSIELNVHKRVHGEPTGLPTANEGDGATLKWSQDL